MSSFSPQRISAFASDGSSRNSRRNAWASPVSMAVLTSMVEWLGDNNRLSHAGIARSRGSSGRAGPPMEKTPAHPACACRTSTLETVRVSRLQGQAKTRAPPKTKTVHAHTGDSERQLHAKLDNSASGARGDHAAARIRRTAIAPVRNGVVRVAQIEMVERVQEVSAELQPPMFAYGKRLRRRNIPVPQPGPEQH